MCDLRAYGCAHNEQFFLTSFYNRDDCFSLLESLWRATRGDDILQESQPINLTQLEGRMGAYAASDYGYR
jgi:hypothetical protein